MPNQEANLSNEESSSIEEVDNVNGLIQGTQDALDGAKEQAAKSVAGSAAAKALARANIATNMIGTIATEMAEVRKAIDEGGDVGKEIAGMGGAVAGGLEHFRISLVRSRLL